MLGSRLLRPFSDAAFGLAGLYLNPRLAPHWRDRVLAAEFPDLADHFWLATSGTGGALKLVALSRAAMAASAAAVNKHLSVTERDCWLNPLPLFHVGGLGIVLRAALSGSRCEFLPDWEPREFVRRAGRCGATLSSLVPTQVHDLVSAGLSCPGSLRAVVVGGGALPSTHHRRAADLGWELLPSYGLTETASQVATATPESQDIPFLPLLPHIEARLGEGGILELRGPSLLSGWLLFDPGGSTRWQDPKVDGWFRTGDCCELQDGSLRFVARADDLVKIRGELVDRAALERDLQSCVASGFVRLDVEPDARNGARLIVVAEHAQAEREAREAENVFPPYARPEVFRIGRIETGPLGKKMRPTG